MLEVRSLRGMVSLVLLLSGVPGMVLAAERLLDNELASLYGGCTYKKYSCVDGQDCPSATGCVDSLDLCCLNCTTANGQKCSDPTTSTSPPNQTCADNMYSCSSGCPGKGFCDYGTCVSGNMNGSEYPDCSENSYQKCLVTNQ